MAPMTAFEATDTCERCGLRRLTTMLAEKGTAIRLCDDCYWGREAREATQPIHPVRLTSAGIHKLLARGTAPQGAGVIPKKSAE